MDVSLLLDLLVKAAVVGFALVPTLRPESSHFGGKAMGVRAWLYPATDRLWSRRGAARR